MKDTKEMFKKMYPCYFSFFVTGMMVLMVGAVLPYLIEDAGINYSIAGGFLSTFAIGNLLASFINPPCIKRMGRRRTVLVFASFIPIGLALLTFLPPIPVIYLIFIFVGIGRGSVSIFNNAVVNDENPGNPIALNILHTICIRRISSTFCHVLIYCGRIQLENGCVFGCDSLFPCIAFIL